MNTCMKSMGFKKEESQMAKPPVIILGFFTGLGATLLVLKLLGLL